MASKPRNDDPAAGKPGEEDGIEQTLQQFEKLVAELAQPNYLFRLYVAGTSLRSTRAIANIRKICEQYLPGRYELQVIDAYQQPDATRDAQVIAVPTLIKEMPFPPQRFVGDMSDADKIVIGLNLRMSDGRGDPITR